MKTIAKSIIAVALALTSTAAFAQSNTQKSSERKMPTPEQMVERRTNQLIVQLGLDDAEAAKFKEIYGRYIKETQPKRAETTPVKAEKKAETAKKPQVQKDSDIDAANKTRFARQRAQIDLQERFYNEFRTILSARQTNIVMRNNSQRSAFGMSQMRRNSRTPQMNGKAPQMRGGFRMPQMNGRAPQMNGRMPQMRGGFGMPQMNGRAPQMNGRMPQMRGGFGMPQMNGRAPQMNGRTPQTRSGFGPIPVDKSLAGRVAGAKKDAGKKDSKNDTKKDSKKDTKKETKKETKK